MADLIAAIRRFIDAWSDRCARYSRTKTKANLGGLRPSGLVMSPGGLQALRGDKTGTEISAPPGPVKPSVDRPNYHFDVL